MFPPPFSLPLRGTFEIVTACGGNLTIKTPKVGTPQA